MQTIVTTSGSGPKSFDLTGHQPHRVVVRFSCSGPDDVKMTVGPRQATSPCTGDAVIQADMPFVDKVPNQVDFNASSNDTWRIAILVDA